MGTSATTRTGIDKTTLETLWLRTCDADGSEGGYFATRYDPTVAADDFAMYPKLPQTAILRAQTQRGGYLRGGGSVDTNRTKAVADPSTL